MVLLSDSIAAPSRTWTPGLCIPRYVGYLQAIAVKKTFDLNLKQRGNRASHHLQYKEAEKKSVVGKNASGYQKKHTNSIEKTIQHTQ